MLTTLFLAAAVTLMPPLPPGAKPKAIPLSPKYQETLSSLGTPMAKTMLVPTAPQVPIQGFVITNIMVANGQVTLGWQDGQPVFQVQGQQNVLGTWSNIGIPTTAQTKTFPIDQNRFFRVVGSNYMQVSITHTNPTTLTWVAPEISMSDSLNPFKVYDAASLPANDTPSSTAGWTLKATIQPGDPLTYDDTTPLNPTEYYKVIEQTANGVVVPYDVKNASGVMPGSMAWVTPLLMKSSGGINIYGIVIDHNDNVIVTGQFSGLADFGNGTPIQSGSPLTFFVAKYSSAGVLAWVNPYDGRADGYGIAVDSQNNIWITGLFQASVHFDPNNTTPTTSTGDGDVFLLKLTSSGSFSLVNHFGSALLDQGLVVRVDSADNVFLTGYFSLTITPAIGHSLTASSGNIFLIKYASDGTWLKQRQLAGSGDNVIAGMTIGFGNQPVLTGLFNGTADFGKGNITSQGADIFIASYASDLSSCNWANTYGGDANPDGSFTDDAGQSVAVDSAGNLWVAGYFYNAIDFSVGTKPKMVSPSQNSQGSSRATMFLVKLNTSGGFLFQNQFGGITGDCLPTAVATDADNNVAFTGKMRGLCDFGKGLVKNFGGIDIFLAKFDSAGGLAWADTFGSSIGDWGTGISSQSISPNRGRIIATGIFGNNTDFGDGKPVPAAFVSGFVAAYTP